MTGRPPPESPVSGSCVAATRLGDVGELVDLVLVLVGDCDCDVLAVVGDAAGLVGDVVAEPVGPVAEPVAEVVAELVGVMDVVGGVLVADPVGGVEPVEEVELVGEVEQVGTVIWLLSSVTAPLRARSRPESVVPVCAVIDVWARMVPSNVVPVPRVAELPTCQKTLQACASLVNATIALDAVMRVLADWKMKTALGSPWASRVTVPVEDRAVPVYTPATNVLPPSSLTAAPGALPAASLYAIPRSDCAC